MEKHSAKSLTAARKLATKLYGRRSRMYLMGDTPFWSLLIRSEDGETNLAVIHLEVEDDVPMKQPDLRG